MRAKAGDPEQLQARRGDVTFVMFASAFRNHQKRDKQLKSQIKVVKRNREIIPTDSPAPSESKPIEPSAREVTIVIKNWIAEYKEHKRSQKPFSSIFTLPSQVKSTN